MDGGIIISGSEWEKVSEPKEYKYFIAKYNSKGDQLWKKYPDPAIRSGSNILKKGFDYYNACVYIDHNTNKKLPCFMKFNEIGEIDTLIFYDETKNYNYNLLELVNLDNGFIITGTVDANEEITFGHNLHIDFKGHLLNTISIIYDFNYSHHSWTDIQTIVPLTENRAIATGTYNYITYFISKFSVNDTLVSCNTLGSHFKQNIDKILIFKDDGYIICGDTWKLNGFVAEVDSSFNIKSKHSLKLANIQLVRKNDSTVFIIGTNYKRNKVNLFIGTFVYQKGIVNETYLNVPNEFLPFCSSMGSDGSLFIGGGYKLPNETYSFLSVMKININ